MEILENFFSQLSGFWDTISMIIQFAIHTLTGLRYLFKILLEAIEFVYQAFGTLPAFFIPIVMVVLGVMILRAVLGRE